MCLLSYALLIAGHLLLAVPALAGGSPPPAPMSPMPMPFVRGTRSPFILPATTTPQQYMVTQPVGSTTYRGYNPCSNADIRVMSVTALEPITTQPVVVGGKTIPGVWRVTSRTEVVDEYSGTRLGRGPETLGSASNPLGGQDRIISIMLVPIPGYPSDLTGVTCLYEHMYGRGSWLLTDQSRAFS